MAALPVALDELATVVGPYASTPSPTCPERIMRSGQEWLPVKDGSKAWTKDPKADLFFNTSDGFAEDQKGRFVVRCRVCALEGTTSTYLLCGGKSSNAWKHFNLVAGSQLSSGMQRSRDSAVSSYRNTGKDVSKVSGSAAEGPISQYLTASRNRIMGPDQARPHDIRLMLMLVMTLSTFAVAGNAYLQEFVRGLGVAYTTPSPAGVRDILMDLFHSVSDSLRSAVRELQHRYKGMPFFHLVTDLWTERHGSGSYRSLALSCVNTDGFTMREMHLGVTLCSGRHDHDNIKRWVLHQLPRFGVKQHYIGSSTTDSGSNVKKTLRQL